MPFWLGSRPPALAEFPPLPRNLLHLCQPESCTGGSRTFPLLLGSWADKPHALRFWLLPPLLGLAKTQVVRPGSATKRGQRSNPEVVPIGSYFPLERPRPTILLSLLLPKDCSKAQSLWTPSLKTSHAAEQTHCWLISPVSLELFTQQC